MSYQDIDPTPDEGTGDTITGFRAAFLYDLDASAHAAAEPEVWGVEELAAGSAVIFVERGPNAGSRFLLDQPVTSIGRNPDSDIYLDDVTVSRRHAELQRQSPEVRIIDLASLNGTYINDKPVESALLANGDEISIGRFRLVFLTRATTGLASPIPTPGGRGPVN